MEIAAVLLGRSGSDEVDEAIGGTTGGTVEVVRRGIVPEKFGRGARDGGSGLRDKVGASGGAVTGESGIVGAKGGGTDGGTDARGGGATGKAGGLIDGARMGEDFATGSGMFDEPEGVTSRGGATLIGGKVSVAASDGKPVAGISGGWGASGSGTRGSLALPSAEGAEGMGVGAVSARFEKLFLGMPTVSFVITGKVPVVGRAGGRARCSIGAISAN